MKKMRKGKKMLLILLAAIAITLVVVLIVALFNKVFKKPEPQIEYQPIISLPETTYSDMQVKNVNMQYLDDQDKTKVSLEIHNTTENTVSNEHLDAILIDASENAIGTMPTWIQNLKPGEQYKIEVILSGNLTSTTQIKLVKK